MAEPSMGRWIILVVSADAKSRFGGAEYIRNEITISLTRYGFQQQAQAQRISVFVVGAPVANPVAVAIDTTTANDNRNQSERNQAQVWKGRRESIFPSDVVIGFPALACCWQSPLMREASAKRACT
jgi:hypothetical protein